eukprot:COSAG02_NODE_21547_length_784_cov_0.724088_3_plen_31_part_01
MTVTSGYPYVGATNGTFYVEMIPSNASDTFH